LLIITARRTKCSVSLTALHICDSAEKAARLSRSAPATSFSFRRVLRTRTSARAQTLTLWVLTRMDGSGICFTGCLANDQNPIAPSQLCQFLITIRFTALTGHCGRSGNPHGNTAILAVSSCGHSCPQNGRLRSLRYGSGKMPELRARSLALMVAARSLSI